MGAVVIVALVVANFWDIVWLFQSDFQRIQGKWKVVSMAVAGETWPAIDARYFIFEGEKVLFLDKDGTLEPLNADFRLDEDHQPAWFDIVNTNGNSGQGIYEVSRDTLRVLLDARHRDRPTTFESKGDSHAQLLVFERE